MRNFICGLLVVLSVVMSLCGCAQKESVKPEEPLVPAVQAAPEPVPVIPEPVQTEPPVPTPAPLPPPAVKMAADPEQLLHDQLTQQQEIVPTEAERQLLLETIHFDFDKSDLSESARDALTNNAAVLMEKNKVNIQIEGHCDERGSAEYNLALGERRARSAMKYLVTLGVPAERLSIISYGEEKPVDPGHEEDAWAKNRRAEFVVKVE